MKKIFLVLGGVFILFGGDRAFSYEPTAVNNGGKMMGRVTVTGEPQPAGTLEVFKHKEVCGEQVPDESLIVGPGGGLRYAVVTLEGITKGKAVEREGINVLDNKDCRFVPHVQVASVGQWLELRNSDPILHNADAQLHKSRPLFNVALPPGKQLRKPLAYPGLISITCDVRHTWMSAYVVVTEHPYHAVTDLYGDFEMRDIPPGTYAVKVWHEKLGTQEKEVVIKPKETTAVNFVYQGEK